MVIKLSLIGVVPAVLFFSEGLLAISTFARSGVRYLLTERGSKVWDSPLLLLWVDSALFVYWISFGSHS